MDTRPVPNLECLARLMGLSISTLNLASSQVERNVENYELLLPHKSNKPRPIVIASGLVRQAQELLLRRVLLPLHRPSAYSHGGVSGRSIITNATPHLDSRFIYKTDISKFFPNIHGTRVSEVLTGLLGCDEATTRICTRLCTSGHCAAQGLVTSPLIADLVLAGVDRRVGRLCEKNGLQYTRFVDDLTISGAFNLMSGTIPDLLEEIVKVTGFSTGKRDWGRIEDVTLTNLMMKRGRLNVRRAYAETVAGQIENARRLVGGETIEGYFYPGPVVLGRILFIGSIRAGSRGALLKRFRAVDWDLALAAARNSGRIAPKPKLRRIG